MPEEVPVEILKILEEKGMSVEDYLKFGPTAEEGDRLTEAASAARTRKKLGKPAEPDTDRPPDLSLDIEPPPDLGGAEESFVAAKAAALDTPETTRFGDPIDIADIDRGDRFVRARQDLHRQFGHRDVEPTEISPLAATLRALGPRRLQRPMDEIERAVLKKMQDEPLPLAQAIGSVSGPLFIPSLAREHAREARLEKERVTEREEGPAPNVIEGPGIPEGPGLTDTVLEGPTEQGLRVVAGAVGQAPMEATGRLAERGIKTSDVLAQVLPGGFFASGLIDDKLAEQGAQLPDLSTGSTVVFKALAGVGIEAMRPTLAALEAVGLADPNLATRMQQAVLEAEAREDPEGAFLIPPLTSREYRKRSRRATSGGEVGQFVVDTMTGLERGESNIHLGEAIAQYHGFDKDHPLFRTAQVLGFLADVIVPWERLALAPFKAIKQASRMVGMMRAAPTGFKLETAAASLADAYIPKWASDVTPFRVAESVDAWVGRHLAADDMSIIDKITPAVKEEMKRLAPLAPERKDQATLEALEFGVRGGFASAKAKYKMLAREAYRSVMRRMYGSEDLAQIGTNTVVTKGEVARIYAKTADTLETYGLDTGSFSRAMPNGALKDTPVPLPLTERTAWDNVRDYLGLPKQEPTAEAYAEVVGAVRDWHAGYSAEITRGIRQTGFSAWMTRAFGEWFEGAGAQNALREGAIWAQKYRVAHLFSQGSLDLLKESSMMGRLPKTSQDKLRQMLRELESTGEEIHQMSLRHLRQNGGHSLEALTEAVKGLGVRLPTPADLAYLANRVPSTNPLYTQRGWEIQSAINVAARELVRAFSGSPGKNIDFQGDTATRLYEAAMQAWKSPDGDFTQFKDIMKTPERLGGLGISARTESDAEAMFKFVIAQAMSKKRIAVRDALIDAGIAVKGDDPAYKALIHITNDASIPVNGRRYWDHSEIQHMRAHALMESMGMRYPHMDLDDWEGVVMPKFVKDMIERSISRAVLGRSVIVGDKSVKTARIASAIYGAWKAGVTVWRLGFYVGNFLSIPGQMALTLSGRETVASLARAGGEVAGEIAARAQKLPSPAAAELTKRLSDIGHRWTSRSKPLVTPSGIYTDDMLEEMARRFGLDSSHLRTEIAVDMINDLRRWAPETEGTLKRNIRKILQVEQARPAQLVRDLARGTELWFRSSVFVRGLEQGLAPEAAAKLARESLYDYGKMNDFERFWVRLAVPFWSFMRANFERSLNAMMVDPTRLGRIARFYRGQPPLFGVTEAEQITQKDTHIAGRQMVYAMEGIPDSGTTAADVRYTRVVGVTAQVPIADFLGMAQVAPIATTLAWMGGEASAPGLSFSKLWRQFLDASIPVVPLTIQAGTERDPVTGVPVDVDFDGRVQEWELALDQATGGFLGDLVGWKEKPEPDPQKALNPNDPESMRKTYFVPAMEGGELRWGWHAWVAWKRLTGATFDQLGPFGEAVGLLEAQPGTGRLGALSKLLGVNPRLIEHPQLGVNRALKETKRRIDAQTSSVSQVLPTE